LQGFHIGKPMTSERLLPWMGAPSAAGAPACT
jgi:hypothetical protein